jgi:hypothetical protein
VRPCSRDSRCRSDPGVREVKSRVSCSLSNFFVPVKCDTIRSRVRILSVSKKVSSSPPGSRYLGRFGLKVPVKLQGRPERVHREQGSPPWHFSFSLRQSSQLNSRLVRGEYVRRIKTSRAERGGMSRSCHSLAAIFRYFAPLPSPTLGR